MRKLKHLVKFGNKYGIGIITAVCSLLANMITLSIYENITTRNILLGVFYSGLAFCITGIILECFQD